MHFYMELIKFEQNTIQLQFLVVMDQIQQKIEKQNEFFKAEHQDNGIKSEKHQTNPKEQNDINEQTIQNLFFTPADIRVNGRNAHSALEIDSKSLSVEQVREQKQPITIDLQRPAPTITIDDDIPQIAQTMTLQLFDGNIIGSHSIIIPGNLNEQKQPVHEINQINQIQNEELSEQSIQQITHIPSDYLPAPLKITVAANGQQIFTPLNSIQFKSGFPLICPQLTLMNYFDLYNSEQVRNQLLNLIHSAYKTQICLYIQRKCKLADRAYANVQILKMVESGWIWDNVIPNLADILTGGPAAHITKARLILQGIQCQTAIFSKIQLHQIMAQLFLGVMPRQLPTHDLPTTFYAIFSIEEEFDSQHILEIKLNKVKCLLHYFSYIFKRFRGQMLKLKDCGENVIIQKNRYWLKGRLFGGGEMAQQIRLTERIDIQCIGNSSSHRWQTFLYLSDQTFFRQEQSSTEHLLFETQRLFYQKPELFALRVLSPRLKMCESLVIYGLQDYSRCQWINGQTRSFVCHGQTIEQEELDDYGKRKGSNILFRSELLQSQFQPSSRMNSHTFLEKMIDCCSQTRIRRQIQCLYSGFKSTKEYCKDQDRIIISEQCLVFTQDSVKELFFMLAWIAASLADVAVVFEFKDSHDRNQWHYLRKFCRPFTIADLLEIIAGYKSILIHLLEAKNKREEMIDEDHENQRCQFSMQYITLFDYAKAYVQ